MNVIDECLIKAEQNVLVGEIVQLPELNLQYRYYKLFI